MVCGCVFVILGGRQRTSRAHTLHFFSLQNCAAHKHIHIHVRISASAGWKKKKNENYSHLAFNNNTESQLYGNFTELDAKTWRKYRLDSTRLQRIKILWRRWKRRPDRIAMKRMVSAVCGVHVFVANIIFIYAIWTNTKRMCTTLFFSLSLSLTFISILFTVDTIEFVWWEFILLLSTSLEKNLAIKDVVDPKNRIRFTNSSFAHWSSTTNLPSYHPDEKPFERFSNLILNSDFDYLLWLVMPSVNVSLKLYCLLCRCVWNTCGGAAARN